MTYGGWGAAVGPADRPQLGDRHLEVGKHLEEESLKLLVAPVNLVDEQDGAAAVVRDGLQEGALEEEGLGEDLVLALGRAAAGPRGELDPEHLLGIVPLVESRRGIEPLVALEADQVGIEGAGQYLRDLGLPHPGVPLA